MHIGVSLSRYFDGGGNGSGDARLNVILAFGLSCTAIGIMLNISHIQPNIVSDFLYVGNEAAKLVTGNETSTEKMVMMISTTLANKVCIN